MGLSNEERLDYMLAAAAQLTRLCEEEKENQFSEQTKGFFPLLNQVWPCLLSNYSDSLYWLLGGSTDRKISETPSSIWELAIKGTLTAAADKLSITEINSEESNPYTCLDVASFLNKEDKFIFKICRIAEMVCYSLRRYDDDFRKSFKEFDDLICRLQGKCYVIFSDKETFAKAYLSQQIVEYLYGSTYPYKKSEWDVVTAFMVKHHLQHNFAENMLKHPLQDLIKIHVGLVNNAVHRVEVLLQLGTTIYEYKHIRDDFEKEFQQAFPDIWQQLSMILEEKQKQYNTDKEKRHKPDPLSDLYCYGHYQAENLKTWTKITDKEVSGFIWSPV